MSPTFSSADAKSRSTANFISKGLVLLEEWPRHDSLTDLKDLIPPANTKHVSFARYSRCRLYNCSSSYRSKVMSYKAADQWGFKANAARDGLQIQRLISSYPPNMNSGSAVHHLMEHEVLSKEDILGIEHYVTEDGPAWLFYVRRAHVASVLMAQKELLEKNDDIADKLAWVSATSSSKSMLRAQLRAALAA